MTDPRERAAADEHFRPWDDFWRNEGGPGGALPAAMAQIDAVQATFWHRFAKRLSRGASTLDVATGDGRVMAHMLKVRPDLRPCGVDLATRLPKPPARCRVRTGVAMERLPFADARFAAVTSQFGIEYGDIDAAAREMARVLVPGAALGLMLHRPDGAILAHNLARRDGLCWALEDQGLIDKARAGLKLRAMGVVVPPALAALPGQAAARFGPDSVACEIAVAVIASLRGGANHPPGHVDATLAMLEAKARNELGRIGSLERACAAVADLDGLQRRVAAAGFEIETVDALRVPGAALCFANGVTARRT